MRPIFISLLCLFATSLPAQPTWTLARDKGPTKVWVMDFPDSNFKQFKSETVVEAALADVVALQLDVANMGKWYDNVGTVTPVEKVSDLEGIYIIDFDMPFPVRDRISAVRAKMTYDQEAKTVYVVTLYEPGIIKETDKIHVKRLQSKWLIRDQGDGTVYIEHSGYMDPSGSLPAWIANTGVKDGPIKSFRGMVQVLPDYAGSEVDWLR